MDFDIIESTGTAVTLERAKQHLNIEEDFTMDDELIQEYIDAAQASCENYIGRPLYENRVYYPDGFVDFEFEAWATAAVTVQYAVEDEEGTGYDELPSANFIVNAAKSTAKIRFTGGLPELIEGATRPVKVLVATACPKPVASAILLVVGDLYARREDRGEVGHNSAANSLCRPYKKWA